MAHPLDEILQQWTDETDSVWSAGDQLNLNKSSDKRNSINKKQKEDTNMDSEPEDAEIRETDITDAEDEYDDGMGKNAEYGDDGGPDDDGPDDGRPDDGGDSRGDGQPTDDQVEVDSSNNVEYEDDNMPLECICQKVTPSTKNTNSNNPSKCGPDN